MSRGLCFRIFIIGNVLLFRHSSLERNERGRGGTLLTDSQRELSAFFHSQMGEDGGKVSEGRRGRRNGASKWRRFHSGTAVVTKCEIPTIIKHEWVAQSTERRVGGGFAG